jgi:hypothetical protein
MVKIGHQGEKFYTLEVKFAKDFKSGEKRGKKVPNLVTKKFISHRIYVGLACLSAQTKGNDKGYR